MEGHERTARSCARRFARIQRIGLSPDGAFSRKKSWLEWKIVCVFFSIFDLIAQSGRYAPGETDLKSFVVEGEQRYWVHVAIDRLTGQVIAKQIEPVNEWPLVGR